MPFDEHQRDIAPEDDLLLRAAENVRRGWCQGIGTDRHGNHCAIGAMVYACTAINGSFNQALINKAKEKLRPLLSVPCIPIWNDSVAESGEEVAQMLERAAGVTPIKEMCHAI